MKKSSEVVFARAGAEHVAEMHEIEEKVFPTPWSYESILQDVVGHDIAYYIVGLCGGKVVSYAGFWFVLDEAHITNVAVRPGYRRQGIGKEMMELLLKETEKRSIVSISLEVRVSNIAAMELYKGLGFRVAGLRKGYYSNNGEDAVLMSLMTELQN